MTEREQKKRGSKGANTRKTRQMLRMIFLLLLLFMIVVLLIRRCSVPEPGGSAPVVTPAIDTIVDTSVSDTVIDTANVVEQEPEPEVVATAPPVPVQKKTVVIQSGTIPEKDTSLSSPGSLSDTLSKETVREKGCNGDTAAVWVYPDPSGGLHYRGVKVKFISNRPVTIHYQLQGAAKWSPYDGTPVPITATTTLFYDAIDSCGNVMERRSEYYEIETARSSTVCPKGMEEIRVGGMGFCIDRYEWPNRRGALPSSYVSFYQATDSCFSAEKRLCTAEEWSIACAGPYSWKYPYGSNYEPHACGTQDTMVVPSGSRPECRGYFGIFDMSGNLLEWTSTRSVENSNFYYTIGGFWESGSKSACHNKRYSYYPQNRHNPVGFRCCSDFVEKKSPQAGGKR